jgi:hypothetical protein
MSSLTIFIGTPEPRAPKGTLDATKDALSGAPGLKCDRSTTTWVPHNK